MRLKEAAKMACDGFAETLAYTKFPHAHWQRIRTNNAIEHLNREIGDGPRSWGPSPIEGAPSCWRPPGSSTSQKANETQEDIWRHSAGRVAMPKAGTMLLKACNNLDGTMKHNIPNPDILNHNMYKRRTKNMPLSKTQNNFFLFEEA